MQGCSSVALTTDSAKGCHRSKNEESSVRFAVPARNVTWSKKIEIQLYLQLVLYCTATLLQVQSTVFELQIALKPVGFL